MAPVSLLLVGLFFCVGAVTVRGDDPWFPDPWAWSGSPPPPPLYPAPTTPDTPTTPSTPTTYSPPDAPTTPETPTTPSTPTTYYPPDAPTTPSTPTTYYPPDAPTTPSTPTTYYPPDAPTTPSTPTTYSPPDVPTTPSTPTTYSPPDVPTSPSTPTTYSPPDVPTTPSTPTTYSPPDAPTAPYYTAPPYVASPPGYSSGAPAPSYWTWSLWSTNTDSWPAPWSPDTLVSDAFGLDAEEEYGQLSLLDGMLTKGDDGFSALLKQGITALLNAVDAHFKYTEDEIKKCFSFSSALSSEGAATVQAKEWEVANEAWSN